MRLSRSFRFGSVAAASAAVAVCAFAAPASASTVSTGSTSIGVVSGWQSPSASRWASAASVTGKVASGQRVRIVRLASVAGTPKVSVVDAVGQSGAEQAVRTAQQAPGTLAVSVDVRRQALDVAQSNDTYRSLQWALTKVDAENVWQYSRGAGVTVAVVDTGVASVADLSGQLLSGADFVTGSGNGTADGNGHGTHVAGIIAAKANNGLGVAGLAPSVKILPVRVLDNDGGGYDSDVANGIIYAADHGASVINLSLGGPGYSSVLAQAVSYAQSKDAVVVAAAGNERQDGNEASYPAALTGVLAVAATDKDNAVASFSNTGSYVGIAAPGVEILSTWINSGGTAQYVYEDGTSMASPYVAATAALVRAANGSLTASQVISDLTSTAGDLSPAGRDNASGSGLVNPLRAVCAVSTCVAPTSTRFDLQPVAKTLTWGSATTVRAQLRNATTGAGLANTRVQWCFNLPGQAAHCAAVTTDATGWTSYRLAPTQTGSIAATFAGTDTLASASTAKALVTVVPKVTVGLAKTAVSVAVGPATKQTVALLRWTGKAWQTVRLSATDTTGHIKWTGLASGATVRVMVAASGGRAAVTTGSYRIP